MTPISLPAWLSRLIDLISLQWKSIFQGKTFTVIINIRVDGVSGKSQYKQLLSLQIFISLKT